MIISSNTINLLLLHKRIFTYTIEETYIVTTFLYHLMIFQFSEPNTPQLYSKMIYTSDITNYTPNLTDIIASVRQSTRYNTLCMLYIWCNALNTNIPDLIVLVHKTTWHSTLYIWEIHFQYGLNTFCYYFNLNQTLIVHILTSSKHTLY